MVGIGAGFAHHPDRLVHGKSLFLHQNTDQLRYNQGRMGIVNLNDRMLIHFAQIIFPLL